jgi:hypothetical protein
VDRSGLTRAVETVAAVGAFGAVAATAHTAVNLRLLRTPSSIPPVVAERVSVLVPARDEAARIARCIASILASDGVRDLEVIVLDDGSSDGTADLVRSTAAGDPRVRVIDGGRDDLPHGWLGKPWACHRLAAAATGSVLLFVDADVVLAPHALAATVALMRGGDLDLVSPYPRQLADGALPRLVQPLLQWSWATLLPVRVAESSPRASLSAANGQLIGVDAAAYSRCGGHDAVRGEVLDDVALLRAVKRSGGHGGVVDGTDLASCRMYDDADALVEGYTKSLWSAFGSPAGSAGVVSLLTLLYVVPPVLGVVGPTARTRALGTLGYAAGVTGRVLVARRTGGRVADSLAHPVSVAVFAGLVAESWRRKGAGLLTWRGRTLP